MKGGARPFPFKLGSRRNISMKYKVLLAIDNQMAENAFKDKISKLDSDYEVVACVVHKNSVLDYIDTNPIDVLVLIEGLKGDTDDFKFAIELKLKYPELRIVFIAGSRSPGDKELAKLVSYQIFDILVGNRVSINDMVNRTIKPATWKEASIYLPNGGKDIFSEDELQQTNSSGVISSKTVDTTVTEVISDSEEHNQISGLSLKDKFNNKRNSMKLVDDDLTTPSVKQRDPKLNDDIPAVAPATEKKKLINPIGPKSKSNDVMSAGSDMNSASAAEISELKKKLEIAERKAQKAEAEKTKILNKNREMSDEYDKLEQELRDLDKSRNVSSKQKVITFYGTVPGVGCTTCALNTAVYLALKGQKVIYIEFNDVLPTLSYWFDLDSISNGLEKAFFGIETRNYQDIDKCIVTKEDILALKSDMSDKHAKYPENLHYMFFSSPYIKSGEIVQTNPNTLKDLLLFLLYKAGYDYIVLDVYSHSDFHILETASIFSSVNVFVMTQDVVTIGASLKMFAALKSNGVEFEFLRDPTVKSMSTVNYKNIYLINKYNNNILLNKKKIRDWLEAEKVATIPDNSVDIINGSFKALPAILVSKNREYMLSIQKLTDMFK